MTVLDPFGGGPDALARLYEDSVLSERLSQLSVSRNLELVRLPSGLSGVRFAYVGVIADTGTSVEGEVTAFVTPSGHGIVFNAWAPAGLLSLRPIRRPHDGERGGGDVIAMIASVPRRRRSPLHDGSLYQPRRPAFWAYAVIMVASPGIVSFGQQSFFRQISPAGWALSWALLAVYALPVLFLVYVLDLYEREPLSLVIGALLWGAIAATTLSGFANDGWGLVVSRVGGPEFAARWTAALTAPFVEETLKGLGVVLIYLIAPDEFDDMMDGFVYGAVCGLGFAVVEDVFYFMGVFGGHPERRPAGVLRPRRRERALFARPVHGTRRDGYRLLRVSTHPPSARAADHGRSRACRPPPCSDTSCGTRPSSTCSPSRPWSGADLAMIPVATAVKGLPLLAFATLAVVLARRRERTWLHGELADEIGGPGISAVELATLEDPGKRRRAVRGMRTRAGGHAAALLRRLQREQVNLAMIRSKVATDDDPALIEQRAYCGSLRDALRAIPGAAPADAAGSAADAGPGDR